MADVFQSMTLDELIDNFLTVLESESGEAVNTQVGSVLRALAVADSVNHSFIQSQIAQVALNSRIDTAEGDDLDTLVNQFSPPFPARTAAVSAWSGPLPPVTLLADATTTYAWVSSIVGMAVGQGARVEKNGKGASATIQALRPTTVLTAAANQGDTYITLPSTDGMNPGATLTLVDGNYSVTVTISSKVNTTRVNISPLTAAVAHTFATATTQVYLDNVIQLAGFALDSGSVITDLTAGGTLRVISQLEGVRFYRNTPSAMSPQIPAETDSQDGYMLQTRVNGIQYVVVADTTNPWYDAGTQSYRIPANGTEAFAKVRAVQAGTGSNILANALNVLPTPLQGVDGATNPYPIQNGLEAEADDALRARFRTFISNMSNATPDALSAAVAGVQSGLIYTILENVAQDGTTSLPGNFVVVVSDENGVLSTDLYNKVYAAVDRTRALTTTFNIKPPTLVIPTIAFVVTVTAGYSAADVKSAVQTAVFNSFSGTPPGGTLIFNKMIQLALDTEGVVDVPKLVVNGGGYDRTSGTFATVGSGPADVTAGALQLLRPSLASIAVN